MLRASMHLLVLLTAAFVAACGGDGDGGGTPTAGSGGGSGAGGPPPELVAELDALPLYPGATPYDPLDPKGVSTGGELQVSYWANGTISEVRVFYDREMPGTAWRAEGPWNQQTHTKGDFGTTEARRSFVKDDLNLTLSVATTEKDPDRGNLVLRVRIEPQGLREKTSPLALRMVLDDGARYLRWDDQEGEAAYRVFGTVTYWPRCEEATADIIREMGFDEQLPADATEFALPEPDDGGDFFLKELTADIFVLGPDGSEMVRDGTAFTIEPALCD